MSDPRKYAMARLGPGDYVVPSNDERVLYRLSSYVDGPSLGLDWPTDRTVWRVRSTPLPIRSSSFDDIAWTDVEEWLPTRKAALAKVFGADA